MRFEWDLEKELKNIQKHGISFSESVETFSDPCGLKFIDQNHSTEEKRYYWVGKNQEGKILTTWFTEREGIIRIIGCGHWRKFRSIYETTKLE